MCDVVVENLSVAYGFACGARIKDDGENPVITIVGPGRKLPIRPWSGWPKALIVRFADSLYDLLCIHELVELLQQSRRTASIRMGSSRWPDRRLEHDPSHKQEQYSHRKD